MSFRRSEAVALGGFLLAWQNSNLQVRRPSWNRPTFWSRSLTSQLARPVPAGTPMTDFLSISGLLNYVAVVDQLVMTIVGPMAGSGIRFEIDVNGSPVPATRYPANIELSKKGPTTYPVVPRPWYLPILETQTMNIRVENLGALQRTVLVAAYGWYYSTVDATNIGVDNGVTDAAYAPVTGGPSR